MIYINPRFPKTKKAYDKHADSNEDKLKSIMEKLVLSDETPKVSGARGLSQEPAITESGRQLKQSAPKTQGGTYFRSRKQEPKVSGTSGSSSSAWSYTERKTRQGEGSQIAWLNRQRASSKPKTFKL